MDQITNLSKLRQQLKLFDEIKRSQIILSFLLKDNKTVLSSSAKDLCSMHSRKLHSVESIIHDIDEYINNCEKNHEIGPTILRVINQLVDFEADLSKSSSSDLNCTNDCQIIKTKIQTKLNQIPMSKSKKKRERRNKNTLINDKLSEKTELDDDQDTDFLEDIKRISNGFSRNPEKLINGLQRQLNNSDASSQSEKDMKDMVNNTLNLIGKTLSNPEDPEMSSIESSLSDMKHVIGHYIPGLNIDMMMNSMNKSS